MIQTPKSFYFAVALVLLTVQAQAASEAFSSGAFGSFSRLLSAPVKTLVTGLPAVRALSDEDNLLDLMGDSEPAVRAQAAKSLRTYVLTSYRVENRLLDAAGDRNEKPEVRREAIKSLAWAAQHYNTKSRILAIAGSSSEAEDLRQIAYKSLYAVVSLEYSVRSALQSALGRSSEPLAVRRAAAWTLWADGADYSSRNALLSALETSEPEALRVEAAKSLFGQMSEYSVKNKVWDIARDAGESEAVREAAVLCLLLINQDYAVKSFLESTARSDRNPVIRVAAVKALQPAISAELAGYFHLAYHLGRSIDPLENQ